MSSENWESELNKLRSSADSLAQCLSALLQRIENLEACAVDSKKNEKCDLAGNATAKMLRRIAAKIGGDEFDDSSEISRQEFVTIDPISGVKKKTIVMERIIDGTFEMKSVENLKIASNGDLLSVRSSDNYFQSRIVFVSRSIIERMEVEFFAGEAIVLKIPPEAIAWVKPGDMIMEINGQQAVHKKQFHTPHRDERVSLKLMPSNIFALPQNFCKILDDHIANKSVMACEDRPSTSRKNDNESDICLMNGFGNSITATNTNLLPYLSFDLKKGDVLQIISSNGICMQARKVNDLAASGFVPLNIRMERVALLSSYGRRVIALLGANGVGRRTLKRMLLQKFSSRFASDVPLTSRAPKQGEVNGRDFHFVIKEQFHDLIRTNQMIEWGEYNGNLYGTSAESVRQIIRSGRVCVLDCTERALKSLYTREFAPYVVVIAAPPLQDELARVAAMRAATENRPPPTEQMLTNTWEENKRLMNSPSAKYFNLVLVNRNYDITLRRLMDALEHLRNESHWIPLDWLS